MLTLHPSAFFKPKVCQFTCWGNYTVHICIYHLKIGFENDTCDTDHVLFTEPTVTESGFSNNGFNFEEMAPNKYCKFRPESNFNAC